MTKDSITRHISRHLIAPFSPNTINLSIIIIIIDFMTITLLTMLTVTETERKNLPKYHVGLVTISGEAINV